VSNERIEAVRALARHYDQAESAGFGLAWRTRADVLEDAVREQLVGMDIRELPGSDCVALRRGPDVDWSVVWLPRSRLKQQEALESEDAARFRRYLNAALAEQGRKPLWMRDRCDECGWPIRAHGSGEHGLLCPAPQDLRDYFAGLAKRGSG